MTEHETYWLPVHPETGELKHDAFECVLTGSPDQWSRDERDLPEPYIWVEYMLIAV